MDHSALEFGKLTPMMRQYYELKARAGDAILLFRMGDFYEIFGTDAETVAPKLELVLTSRERGDQKKIPFCGVPHHSAKGYWLKLVKLGFKVAFADQVEDPKDAKGLVKRDITKIITPGSIDELEGLEREQANYLMAIYQHPEKHHWLIALADTSSGELRLGSVASEAEIPDVVGRFRPRELLTRRFYHGNLRTLIQRYLQENQLLIGELPEAPLRDQSLQEKIFRQVFAAKNLKDMPCGPQLDGEGVVAAIFTYLESLLVGTNQFVTVRPLADPETMILDEIARRDLEIFETARSHRQTGSLFYEINRTLSPMGARLLKSYLTFPLVNLKDIQARQDAVSELKSSANLAKIRDEFQATADLERLTTRTLGLSASPSELMAIRETLAKLPRLIELISGMSCPLIRDAVTDLRNYASPLTLLNRALQEFVTLLGSGVGVFRPGFDQRLDELNEIAQNGAKKVSDYEAKLRTETGINSLKIKHHQTFGLLIEITRANIAKVPKDFIRKQTMVNNERFITPELLELSDSLANAREHALQREAELYRALLVELAKSRDALKATAGALAKLDVWQSFAWKAEEASYSRPRSLAKAGIDLKLSRHPVVEYFVGRHSFVANDLQIAAEHRHVLITGPNMAGKSTIMRQIALTAILHQIGAFVPAEHASLPVFDRIFTRVGASDDLSRGHSTFFIEMAEAAQILRHATDKSLVILDEVGRGTSTQDGLALASAILEALVKKVGCYTLFATHYHELVELAESLNVRTMQTEVVEIEGDIKLTHRFIDGASGSSFGIEVAKIAGIPADIIERAKILLRHTQARYEPRGISPEIPSDSSGNDGGFTNNKIQLISERLDGIRIHKTTPLQALNILDELKSLLTSGEQPSLFDQ